MLYLVDDELPDYIMVMIANKKPVDQMTSDLDLFLGDNADPFTQWYVYIYSLTCHHSLWIERGQIILPVAIY